MYNRKLFYKNEKDYADAIYHHHNTTLYGEFVCSAYKWLPLDTQKENAERFQTITRNK